jgi:hypothetical protein
MSMYPPVRDTMIRLLSTPRLDTYANEYKGDIPSALELYRWNLDISMAFFESIHYFEVAFRNAIDTAMEKWFLATYGAPVGGLSSWLETKSVQAAGDTPAKLSGLNGNSVRIVEFAVHQAGRRHNPVNHGHVVAELTLGFWHFLIKPAPKNAAAAHQNMWGRALKPAFVSSVSQTKLDKSVDRIVSLRNRIAHHEPIFALGLKEEYENLIVAAEQVAPGLGWWIDTTSRVERVLAERPD